DYANRHLLFLVARCRLQLAGTALLSIQAHSPDHALAAKAGPQRARNYSSIRPPRNTQFTVSETKAATLQATALHPASRFPSAKPPVRPIPYWSLIWTSTPAARSSFMSASTVLSVGLTISIRRLCVRSSYWSRASLLTCGEISTVKRSCLVGSGIGPFTWAPVRLAVSTISFAERSIRR